MASRTHRGLPIVALRGEVIDAMCLAIKRADGVLRHASEAAIGDWVRSSSRFMNEIFGGGFVSAGRQTEIFGWEATGKSLLGYDALVSVTTGNRGKGTTGIGILIDTEHAFVAARGAAMGIDLERLIVCYPSSLQEGFKMIATAVQKIRQAERKAKVAPMPIVVVWDSVAASTTETEQKEEAGAVGYKDHSRIISAALRKMTPFFAKYLVGVVWINQLRKNISAKYGDADYVTFGGHAIGFYSDIRVLMKRVCKVKNKNGTVVGLVIKVTTEKNRICDPFKVGYIYIDFKRGLSSTFDLICLGAAAGVLEVKGSFKSIVWKDYGGDGNTSKPADAKWSLWRLMNLLETDGEAKKQLKGAIRSAAAQREVLWENLVSYGGDKETDSEEDD